MGANASQPVGAAIQAISVEQLSAALTALPEGGREKLVAALGRANKSSAAGTGKGNMDIVTLSHTSGATAEVYLFGATLTSYKTSDRRERIFVSPSAIYDGKKAIRGGVPVVFPQFGQPDKAMAQHGFARSSMWTVKHLSDCAEESKLILGLSETEETFAKWPHKFQLQFIVSLTGVSLNMSLVIKNTGDAPFDFMALLHTYFAIPDGQTIDDVVVKGLQGRQYVDKVQDGQLKCQHEADITLPSFTDHIYKGDTKETSPDDKDVRICSKAGKTQIVVVNSAKVDRDPCPIDIVVWNPYEDASPGDLPPPAYKHFVCVEPGLVAKAHTLQTGGEAVVRQKIYAF